MGDFFHETVHREHKEAVYRVIEQCSQHTFIFLTKRPQNVSAYWMPQRANVWLGVTAENQSRADERIPILLQIPAAVRFVSVEPMLGAISFDSVLEEDYAGVPCQIWPLHGRRKIDWVICGGETGPGARPMQPEWVSSLRDQCVSVGVPFFFKSWGGRRARIGSIPIDPDGHVWRQFPEVSR
jgi:protein gp37